MTAFRRHRSRDGRKPAFSGGFPPPAYDASTIEFSGASGAGLPGDAIYGPAPDDTVTVKPEWWRP